METPSSWMASPSDMFPDLFIISGKILTLRPGGPRNVGSNLLGLPIFGAQKMFRIPKIS